MIVSLWSLLACSGESEDTGTVTVRGTGPVADYVLRLVPVVANNQSPFDDLDKLDLVIEPEVGDPVRVSLEDFAEGVAPSAEDLPALEDATITVEGYSDGDLVTWGRTERISLATGEEETQVFVASTEAAAWLTPLSEGLWLPQIVSLGDGEFMMYGGVTNNRSGAPDRGQDAVFTLSLAPPEDVVGFTSVGTAPTYLNGGGDPQTARMGATFTPLNASGGDQGKILVVGGSEKQVYAQGSTSVSPAAALFDPSSGDWEDPLPENHSLTAARSQHIAIENTQGNVVVWGGWGYVESNDFITWVSTVEVYDRASESFEVPSTQPGTLGEIDAGAADLENDGTLLCGGADIDLDNDNAGIWVSSETCVTVSVDGTSIADAESLPVSLAAHAMITLRDGRVLVTGGVTSDSPRLIGSGSADARGDAWIYTPATGSWTGAGAMNMERAGHRMALLPDGRVLIVGGATEYQPAFPVSDALSCLEVFDPDSSTFRVVDGCTADDDAGGLPNRAFEPAIAADPERGVLIVGGLGSDGGAQSGVSLFVSGG